MHTSDTPIGIKQSAAVVSSSSGPSVGRRAVLAVTLAGHFGNWPIVFLLYNSTYSTLCASIRVWRKKPKKSLRAQCYFFASSCSHRRDLPSFGRLSWSFRVASRRLYTGKKCAALWRAEYQKRMKAAMFSPGSHTMQLLRSHTLGFPLGYSGRRK